jgi:hypothetical protein
LELTILFSETNKIHKSLELVNYRLAFARLITIILPYNFVSPIILNTFASIAVALAKVIPTSTEWWILYIVRQTFRVCRTWPYSSMDRTEVS